MNDMDFVNDLKANGFTDKDISRLRTIVESVPTKDQTFSSIVLDLSKRFWGGVIGMLLMAVIAIFGSIYDSAENFVIYLIVILFGVTVVYIVTPMKLAWKAHRYMAKKK
ncbi:hypothetical protein ABEI05_07770 [Erwinia billingiae]|uniref:hypothetical protein n=1 Tax=Erwinia TaxID=551 RepID=UPI0010709685|nr:hypothetical protein [Erwinia sp. QL-Z3]QBR51278.1 hypothetical protein E2F51_15430 [Erwinia sp. QL-Z3]